MGKRKTTTGQHAISAIDLYMNRAFRFMVVLIPLVALCSGAEDVRTVYQGRPLPITITIGAAVWNRTKDMERMIKEADINLYYGKQHGKNRVIA